MAYMGQTITNMMKRKDSHIHKCRVCGDWMKVITKDFRLMWYCESCGNLEDVFIGSEHA
jgi:formamidopyrimidine-DNA glycosylase